MKTLVVIEVEHKKPLPNLAEMVAQRAYTLHGVDNAVVREDSSKVIMDSLEGRAKLREVKEQLSAMCDRIREDLK